MELSLAGDSEAAWILARTKERAIVFQQTGEEGIVNVRTPSLQVERAMIIVVLHAEADSGHDDSSVIFNADFEASDGSVSALCVADRECEPFWFGLKASLEALVYERSFDYSELEAEVACDASLEQHARVTKGMCQSLVFRALNRRLDGRLESLISKIGSERWIREMQSPFLHSVALDLFQLTSQVFPGPSSVEEEVARSVLIAIASQQVIERAGQSMAALH